MKKVVSIFTLPGRVIKETTTIDSTQENTFLNGVRGLSVFIVIFSHAIFFPMFNSFKHDTKMLHDFIYQIPTFLSFLYSGDKVVDIFFILSAYLLSSQLFIEISKYNKINLFNFYIKRIFRIFPVYIIALILFSLAYRPSFYPHVVHSILFIDNIMGTSIVPVGWSLALEVQFYLVLPFLIWFCHKIKLFTPLFLVSLVVASVVFRYLVCLKYPVLYETKWFDFIINGHDFYEKQLYFPTYVRFAPLVLGMLWAYTEQSKRAMNILRSLSTPVVFIIFTIALIVGYYSLRFPFFHKDVWFYQPFNPTVNMWWIMLHRVFFSFSIIVVFMIVDLRQLPQLVTKVLDLIFSNKYWRVISQLSYPMYLFHFPFVGVGYVIVYRTIDIKVLQNATMLELFISSLVTSFLTMIFCTYIYRLIEQPLIRKGKSIVQRRREKSAKQVA